MTEATDTKLMDTEPGGENTQYEGQQVFVKSHAKEGGQFKDSVAWYGKGLRTADPNPNEAVEQAAKEKAERGEKTAENVRYGEAISEHGFGGETVGNDGKADGSGDLGFGSDGNSSSRMVQGYGDGSGIGG